MKKILKMFLVLALVLVQIVPMFVVNAAETTQVNSGNSTTKGKITISNASDGKTYKLYRVLVLESYDKDNAYAYKVAAEWKNFVESNSNLAYSEDGMKYVSWVGNKDAATVAKFAQDALKFAQTNGISAVATQVASGTTVTFDNLDLGYYLVDSSTGVLCSLNTTDNVINMSEKNTIPTVKKTVEENGTYRDSNDASIGDVVKFKTEITVGKGAVNYVLHDTMSGLTLNTDLSKFVVTASNGTASTGKYTVNTNPGNGESFTITFDNDFVIAVGNGNKITVEYEATLNSSAVIGAAGNKNETYLVYGDTGYTYSSNTDETITTTYGFDIVKTKSDNTVLEGAEFILYKGTDYASGTTIKVESLGVVDGIQTYRVLEDQSATGVNIQAGVARIIGLDSGNYKLYEAVVPNGYNRLAQDASVSIDKANKFATVTDNKYDEGGVRVINLTGAELPDTGGMGTTLFITIGSLMVLLFGVLLVTKLRMSKVSL